MNFNFIGKILDGLQKADDAIQVAHGVVKAADTFVSHLKDVQTKKGNQSSTPQKNENDEHNN